MLKVDNIEVLYQGSILVLRGVSLEVPDGQIITILGANGAGKTTTLRAISGLLKPEEGEVSDGSIEFDGQRVENSSPEFTVKLGIVQVMEGRRSFEHLTVEENLLVGSALRKDMSGIKSDLEMVYGYFPRLKELRRNVIGWCSGGEQQMTVIGRGMMSHPKLMLLDEPSLGLSPTLVLQIFDIVRKINTEMKIGMLLVEQNALAALNMAEYGYVMENGRVVLDGPSPKLIDNEDVKEFYLGLTEIGKRSYRDAKHYKRRKRWLA
ncbi:MAG TPA: ABC transporter ATP-binding protein [Dehalococcoidia bacterium]|nr:ABC transporter ATP-binding protein [Dehalococcoidia bacterium]